MTLLNPWAALLLVPVAVLAIGYLWQQRRRGRYAMRMSTAPMLARLVGDGPRWRRHVAPALVLLALTALGLGAARPEAEIRVPQEEATIIVAIDVSLSMRATDIEPSRIEAAAAEAGRFVEELPPDLNVGIVTFSGTTAVLAQPAADRAVALAALQDLQLESRTAIGEGVFTSLRAVAAHARLSADQEIPGHVVLLSDGRNTFGRSPDAAAEAAREAGVPVSTIGYGEAGGTYDLTSVDTGAMTALAETTGGEAYQAGSVDELDQVYADINRSIGWRTERVELSPYLSAGGLGVLLLALTLSWRWFARIV